MTCCRCNKYGSCKGCSCAKERSLCVCSLPGKQRKLVNPMNSTLPSSQCVPSSLQTDTTVPRPASVVPSHQNDLQANTTAPAATVHQSGEYSIDESLREPVHVGWSLPESSLPANPIFTWGSLDACSFIKLIEKAYAQVVHWKMNTFPVPFGKAGRQFVIELARLYRAFRE